jgi:hypothetical protein
VNPRLVRVTQSSGNPAYDQVAVRAVLEASPFPPLPEDFKDKIVTMNIQFRTDDERAPVDRRAPVADGASGVVRRAIRVVDADPADAVCKVRVELSAVPPSEWRDAWRSVAPRFALDEAVLVGSAMTFAFEVVRLDSLPRIVDDAIAAANLLWREAQRRNRREAEERENRDRRKEQYIHELNQRLR